MSHQPPGPLGPDDERAQRLLARIRDVPDFPKPGVVFKDISPLLADHTTFTEVVDALAAPFVEAGVDAVAGIEARGFVLGAPVALELGAGFVPVRKQGKLPGTTVSASYELEYGSAVLEVTSDAFITGCAGAGRRRRARHRWHGSGDRRAGAALRRRGRRRRGADGARLPRRPRRTGCRRRR